MTHWHICRPKWACKNCGRLHPTIDEADACAKLDVKEQERKQRKLIPLNKPKP